MKRLGSLISSIMAVAVLTGCGSQTAATFAPIQDTNNSNVSIQSAQGLKSFYSVLTEKVFVSLDSNKDKSISFDEFRIRQNMTPGFSSAPVPNPQPVTIQTVTTTAQADALQTFLKIDKNRNGKISMTEAKASKYFLGVSQLELRKMFKPLFDNFDTNKNQKVSKTEFFQSVSGLDQSMQQNMMGLFFSSDKNVDNNLSFSEFEDMLYASFKATWEIPSQPTPAPTTTPSGTPGEPPAPQDPNQPTPPSGTPAQPDPNPAPAQPVPATR